LITPLLADNPPKLSGLYPAGIAPGSEATVEAIDATVWPVQVWCSAASLQFDPLPEKGKLKVTAPASASPGPVLVRLFNEAGCSDARIFVVGTGPELIEAPKNDRPAEAQPVPSLPVTLNGILERRGDVDFFRLSLKKGQILGAQLDAYSLRSEIDPFLQLIGPDGQELLLASDTHNLDPAFETTIPVSGDYLLQINAIAHKASAEVSFAGDKDKIYRLRLQTGPLPSALPKPDSIESTPQQPIKAPHRLQGTLAMPGERDRFRIEATAGSKLRVRVEARAIHLLTDPVLRVFKADGSLLREVDDFNNKPDPASDLTVEAAGFFEVEVRDRFGRAGLRYQLVVEPISPSFRADAAQDSVVITGGKTAELTLNLVREDGHKAPLELVFADLPDGVTAKADAIPAKTGTVKIKFTAEGTAAACQKAFHIGLKETASAATPRPVVRTWQTEESRGDYLINDTPDFWMTVIAIPPPAPKAEAPPAAPSGSPKP
jgi:hypothetical protein